MATTNTYTAADAFGFVLAWACTLDSQLNKGKFWSGKTTDYYIKINLDRITRGNLPPGTAAVIKKDKTGFAIFSTEKALFVKTDQNAIAIHFQTQLMLAEAANATA